MAGAISRVLRRLTSSNTELENAELQRQARRSGVDTLGRCSDRSRVVLTGTITSLSVQPRGETKWLEAVLSDGSGTVRLLWMGRRSIPGIEAGAVLRVAGRIAEIDGDRVIYNPHYDLLSVPTP